MGLLTKARNRKWIILPALLLVFIAAAMVLPGCGDENKTTTSVATSAGGGVFSYAEAYDPPALDPALIEETVGANIGRYLYDGLVRQNPEGVIEPAMADSWEISDDSTVLTFHLRQGARFSNGREVKAGDFVYAWARALSPGTKSPMVDLLMPIEGSEAVAGGEATTLAGVQAVDDYTLKVTLSYPFADFLTYLGDPIFAPVPQEAVEDPQANFAEMPVGNGPFMLKEWRHGEQIVLVRNPDYYGDPASLDEVTVKIIANPMTALAELKAGNIDAVKQVMPSQIAEVRADSSLKLLEAPVDGVQFAGFNISQPPWQESRLRQALNYAVDRETITDKLLQGLESPADGIIPESMAGHQANAMPYRYDPEKARALLAEAGYPEGQGLSPLQLAYTGDGFAAEVAQAMQSSFAEIGVEVELQELEQGVLMEGVMDGTITFFILGMVADAPTPDALLFPLFDSSSIGAYNVFQYENPDVDRLLAQARQTADSQERLQLYDDAQELILADAPLVPLTFAQDNIAYASRVTRLPHSTSGDLVLDGITVSNN